MSTNYKDQVNSCIIAPLFWYNDWPRLFIFLEWWRQNKINNILLHVHSISKTTKRVLDYYIAQGLVKVRPFPLMPYTRQYNPNNHVYYSAERLTTAFCGVWSDTRYTTMNDVDELFFVRNQRSLLEMAKQLMDPIKHPDVGSIRLAQYGLAFPNGFAPKSKDFARFLHFTKRTNTFKMGPATKYIYQTEYAATPFIHQMKRFFANKREEKANIDQAVYLHIRNEFNQTPPVSPSFNLFEDAALGEMEGVLEKIFPNGVPPYKFSETFPKIKDCIERSATEVPEEECIKPTGTTCYMALKDLDEWIYAKPIDDSKYTVV